MLLYFLIMDDDIKEFFVKIFKTFFSLILFNKSTSKFRNKISNDFFIFCSFDTFNCAVILFSSFNFCSYEIIVVFASNSQSGTIFFISCFASNGIFLSDDKPEINMMYICELQWFVVYFYSFFLFKFQL